MSEMRRLRSNVMAMFRPPRNDTVSDWADRNRVLVSESSSEPGPWRTDRAPHEREPMNAFTQKGIKRIVMLWGSQVGKSEVLLNCMGRSIELDPGPMLYVQPNGELSEDFSRRRVAPMFENCRVLKKLVAEVKSRDSSNTIDMKTFPGGSIAFAGATSPRQLASKPIRYLFLDEVDGFPESSGTEGDPVKLAEKRTATFPDAMILICSTPTMKNKSKIYAEYKSGTQEEWCSKCPKCGKYVFIRFDDIRFKCEEYSDGEDTHQRVTNAVWCCPECRHESSELEVKRSPAKYIARNPKAIDRGIRSFKINALASPWGTWESVCQKYVDAGNDQDKLKVFWNTEMAEVYEMKEHTEEPDKLYDRREHYDAEVPDGPVVLTCGIDTQGDRLEYEVVGWNQEGESWGIERGIIPGRADQPECWQELDKLLERRFTLKNGRELRIGAAFIDSGGNHTQDVYRECERRMRTRLFPIKGDDGYGRPYVSMSKKAMCKKTLFIIGVDSGKDAIFYSVGLEEPGPGYMHFPDDDRRGYDREYFKGLMSERMEPHKVKGKIVIGYRKIYERNEPLDIRNYARAAWYIVKWHWKEEAERLYGAAKPGQDKTENTDGKKTSQYLVSPGIKVR